MLNEPLEGTSQTMPPYRMTPYSYQTDGTRLLIDHPYFGLFDDMGTGKTKTFIDAVCRLRAQARIHAVVVVCPNSLKNNWAHPETGQIVTHGWDVLEQTVYVIRAGQKLYAPTDFTDESLIWVVVNYESVWREKIAAWLQAFMQYHNTVMVLDESQRIKNPTSAQSKGCIKLGQYAKRRYILTGTPVTKNPLDFWAQFRFLHYDITGHKYFNTFRLRYAKLVEQTIGQRTFKTVVGFQNIPELLHQVGPYYRRVEKKDCLDLPDKVFMRREIDMNPEQVKNYIAMSERLVCELEGVRVVARIALTKILRLLQITCGYTTQEDQCYYLGNSPKTADLVTVAEEHDGQLIIFYRENPERALLEDALTNAKVSYACIHGGVKEAQRTEMQQAFQQTSQYKVMLANVAVGGIGVDLTAADLVLYHSNSHSLEHRWQSEDRAMRIGQHKKVTYIDFLATLPGPIMTMDHTVLRALEMKVNLADLVVKNVANLTAFFKGELV
jgi:SNF2 family DNA or RNA helicase